MAELNPNEEELLILPDDDFTTTIGGDDDSSSTTTSDDTQAVKKADKEELITFDDAPIFSEETETPEVSLKLDALEQTPSNTTEELSITEGMDKNEKEEALPTIDLGEDITNAEESTVESGNLDMSALLGEDEPVVVEEPKTETPKEKNEESENLLGGLMDEVIEETPTELVETTATSAATTTKVGTMEEILEETVSEFEAREKMIQEDLDVRNNHIQELEEELQVEKTEVASLETEQKALKTNRQKIMDMIKGVLSKATSKTTRKTTLKK